MAKKNKSQKLTVGVQSFWDGCLSELIGTLFISLFLFILFAAAGIVIAFSLGAFSSEAEGWLLACGVVSIVLFTIIGFCWACVFFVRWSINHTVISGHRLHFNASTANLFFNLVKWSFFLLITLGIYVFWLPVKIKKWQVSNTTCSPEQDDYGFAPPEVSYYYDDDDE